MFFTTPKIFISKFFANFATFYPISPYPTIVIIFPLKLSVSNFFHNFFAFYSTQRSNFLAKWRQLAIANWSSGWLNAPLEFVKVTCWALIKSSNKINSTPARNEWTHRRVEECSINSFWNSIKGCDPSGVLQTHKIVGGGLSAKSSNLFPMCMSRFKFLIEASKAGAKEWFSWNSAYIKGFYI